MMHTHYRPKVYGASKLIHAPMWQSLRTAWISEVEFTSRWPDLVGQVPDNDAVAREFWLHDIQDVARADCVIVYAQPTEHLRGALVEAGAGIALGKHVILVGDNPDWGTWCRHPLVTKVEDMNQARYAVIGSWRR